MTINDSLRDLCIVTAERLLHEMLASGPKPVDTAKAFLWEQQTTRLQGQINSLSALATKLTAQEVIQAIKDLNTDLEAIDKVSKKAQEDINKIKKISDLLSIGSKILDLGLAVLAVAASPSSSTIKEAAKVGKLLLEEA